PHAMPSLISGLGACCGSSAGGNLAYEGGAVQVAPVVYLDFAGSQWQDGFTDGGGYTSATAMQYLTGFFAGAGGTSWNGSQTQYCMGPAVPQGTTDCTGLTTTGFVGNPSSVYGGGWIDPIPWVAVATPYTGVTVQGGCIRDPKIAQAICVPLLGDLLGAVGDPI